jgi:hypothetical protein
MRVSKQVFVSSLLVWTGLAPPVGAVRCGEWFSNDCRGETDVRYDKSYTNDIKEQADLWPELEGYWINTGLVNLDNEGNIRGPSVFYLPYTFALGFYNETFDGSRYVSSRYYVYEAADDEFCQQPVPPGFTNTIGEGVCGVNGWSNHAEIFGTSSYEKDGTISLFKSTGDYSYPGVTQLASSSVFTPVDERTATQEVSLSQDLFSSAILVFLRNFTEYSATNNVFSFTDLTGNPLRGVNLNYVIKVTEQEWLDQLEQAYVDYNVLAADQVQGGQLPMQTECVSANAEGCPTEEEWCEQDPECSESPYKEPDGTIKAGPIIGFVIWGAVMAFMIFYLWHRYKLDQQASRYKKQFAQRVVGTMSVRASISQLPPESLANEFKRIAKGTKEGGSNGHITKEELWDFLSTGKAGDISESDVNALFAAMDLNSSGTVNFVEFCTFMGQCQDEFRSARGELDGDKLSVAARRLSAVSSEKIPIAEPEAELEAEDMDTDQTKTEGGAAKEE